MRINILKINMYRASIAIIALLIGLLLGGTLALASETDGTIVSGGNNGYAWSDQIGWINFGTANGNMHIKDSGLIGYAWSATKGWINMAPSQSGVNVAPDGKLSGSAWGSATGWIDFSGVSISASGVWSGTATGTVIGTLTFDCSYCDVKTDYVPIDYRQTPPQAQQGGGGGTIFGCTDKMAINYNPSALNDNKSCVYSETEEDTSNTLQDTLQPAVLPTSKQQQSPEYSAQESSIGDGAKARTDSSLEGKKQEETSAYGASATTSETIIGSVKDAPDDGDVFPGVIEPESKKEKKESNRYLWWWILIIPFIALLLYISKKEIASRLPSFVRPAVGLLFLFTLWHAISVTVSQKPEDALYSQNTQELVYDIKERGNVEQLAAIEKYRRTTNQDSPDTAIDFVIIALLISFVGYVFAKIRL